MNDDPIIKLVTTKPDKEVADELRLELIDSSKSWLEVCTKAHKLGFIVQANFGPNFSRSICCSAANLN